MKYYHHRRTLFLMKDSIFRNRDIWNDLKRSLERIFFKLDFIEMYKQTSNKWNCKLIRNIRTWVESNSKNQNETNGNQADKTEIRWEIIMILKETNWSKRLWWLFFFIWLKLFIQKKLKSQTNTFYSRYH